MNKLNAIIILKMLDEMALAISELRLVGEKVLKGDHDGY